MVELLPNVPLQDALRRPVGERPRTCLSHRAGFPAFFWPTSSTHLGYEPRDVLRRIRYVEASQPRSATVLPIPTSAFSLAGELAAAAGGQPFTDLKPQLDLPALAMTRTGIASPLDPVSGPGQSGA